MDSSTPAQTAPRRRSIDSVQYLRGVATLAVLASHALGHPLEVDTRNMLVTGRLGVLLFFVISGFIMVFVTGDGAFDARSFLVKRIVRVVPFYWIVTLFAALTAVVAPSAFKATVVTLPHLVASLLFIPAENPAKAGAVLPLVKLGWTLNYEMFFYVVFACLAGLALRVRFLALALGFAVLVALGQAVRFTEPVPLFYTAHVLLGFVSGVGLGLFFVKRDFLQVPSAYALGAAIAGAACFGASYGMERDAVTAYSLEITLLMIVGCTLLVFLGLWLEVHGRLFRSRALHFIGDASYSIYLVHLFGVGFAVQAARRLHILPSGVGYLGIVAAGFAAGLVAGCLAHVWIERPLTRWSRREVRPVTPQALPGT